VLVIPGFAFASEIIPVFSRKAIFGYPIMVAATLAIGFIGMSVIGSPRCQEECITKGSENCTLCPLAASRPGDGRQT